MKAKFIVTVELPWMVNEEEMRDYIYTEVVSGCGRFDPEDPMAHLNRDEVKVKIKRRKLNVKENGGT